MEPETKAGGDQSPKAALDQRASETAGVRVLKEVVGGGSEEASAPPLLAHWCSSLLQLLLRACTGCLGLHGYDSSDNDGPKPAADDDDDPKPAAGNDDASDAPAAVVETPKEGAGGGGGEADSHMYLQEVGTRMRKPTPPGPPRPGSGGGGGQHN